MAPRLIARATLGPVSRSPHPDSVLALELQKAERDIIARFLKKHHGHLGKTAEALGISYRSLTAKVTAHGLQGEAAELRAEAGTTGPRNV